MAAFSFFLLSFVFYFMVNVALMSKTVEYYVSLLAICSENSSPNNFTVNVIRKDGEVTQYYKEYYLCSDERTFHKMVENLLQSNKFYLQNADKNVTTKLVIMFTYLPGDILELVANMTTPVPIISLSGSGMLRNRSQTYQYFDFFTVNKAVKSFANYIKQSGWGSVWLLTVLSDNKTQLFIDDLYRHLSNVCMIHENLVKPWFPFESMKDEVIKMLREKTKVDVVIIVGTQYHIMECMNWAVETGFTKFYWLFVSTSEINLVTRDPSLNTNSEHLSDQDVKLLTQQYFLQFNYNFPAGITVNRTLKYKEKEKIKFDVYYPDKRCLNKNIDSCKLNMSKLVLNNITNKGSCFQVKQSHSCKPGYERKFGEVITTVYERETGWICAKCLEGYIKSDYEDGSCTACPDSLRANDKRTACIDSTETIYPTISTETVYPTTSTEINDDRTVYIDPVQSLFTIEHEELFILFLIITVFGMFATLVIIVVFLKYRNTPVIKCSDLQLTLVQLILMVCIYIALLLFKPITKISNLPCLVPAIIIGLCFTLIIVIIYFKIKKIEEMCETSENTTRGQRIHSMMFKIIYALIILFEIIIICSVIILKYQMSLKELQYCDTGLPLHIQAAYFIILLMICLAWRYKQRKLPWYYGEGTSIVVAAFVLICCFVTMIVISHLILERCKYDEQMSNLTFIAISNILLLFSLYGYKLYLIIFHPDLNSRQEFERIRLVNNQAMRLISHESKVVYNDINNENGLETVI